MQKRRYRKARFRRGFHTGGGAHDANDRIIYDTDSGALSYDADGSGQGAAICKLSNSGEDTGTMIRKILPTSFAEWGGGDLEISKAFDHLQSKNSRW